MASFEDIRDRLLAKLARESKQLEHYDDYLEAEQPLEFLSPVLSDELEGRIKEMVFNLPRFATEAYDNRLDLRGFRFRGSDDADDELWSVFQANDGVTLSQQVHFETLGLGRAYVIVGEGDDADVPLITAESAFQAIHELNPRTKNVEDGIKTWTDEDDVNWCSLYHPFGRLTWWQQGGRWREDTGLAEANQFGIPRLVPVMNQQRMLARPRLGSRRDYRLGRSIFHDVVVLTDAINKMLTDMMVSGEFHAMPRRWAVGLTDNDFVDEKTGEALKTWELIAGRIWASENKDVKMGQFDEADLTVFHNTVKLLIQCCAMLLGLPTHYLTFQGDNPPSADAIRSSESQMVKRAERMQPAFGWSWERVSRLVLLTLGYPDTRETRTIESLWRDPSTPTVAQEADAITKLVTTKDSTGRSVVPLEMARERLGYTPKERERMEKMDAMALRDPLLDYALDQTE